MNQSREAKEKKVKKEILTILGSLRSMELVELAWYAAQSKYKSYRDYSNLEPKVAVKGRHTNEEMADWALEGYQDFLKLHDGLNEKYQTLFK